MTLRKKLMVFMAVVLIIPIMLITIMANRTGKIEQQKVFTNTLQAGLKVVRGEMLERKNGMRRVCNYFADSEETQQAVLNKNTDYLTNRLTGLKRYFEYVDYVAVVDKNNESLARLSFNMRYNKASKLGILVERAMASKQVFFSEEDFQLNDLFVPNSLEYDKFLIKEYEKDSHKLSIIKKALTSVAIMPIYKGHDSEEVIGAIVVCDIFNNDLAFPNYVGNYSKDALVLASMDGVRVAANYALGGENLLGTPIALKEPFSNNHNGIPQHLSSLQINGNQYQMLNEEILDSNKQPIGLIGMGLPIKNYYTWPAASDYFVLFALGLYGIILALAWLYINKDIAEPFSALTDRMEKYWQENYPQEQIANPEFEGEALTQNFNLLTEKISAVEKDKEKYCNKFKEEFTHQTYLTNELRYLNSNLERQVEERTQHLGTMVEELRRTNAVKTRFLANLGHELRTPLNIIMSSAEVLQDEILGKLNTKQKNYAQGIYSSGSHLLSLINNLLSLSKMEFGKQKLRLSNFDLKETVEEVVRNVRKFDPKKKLNITATFISDSFLINADPQMIRQIIYNLMSNAVKFTPTGGHIEVRAAKEGEMVRLVVKDDGVGIAKQDLPKVFKEFEQGYGTAVGKYDDTGLGLPMVKHLTELHGGTVYLESVEGNGCTVTVLLPLNTQEFLDKRQAREGAKYGNNLSS